MTLALALLISALAVCLGVLYLKTKESLDDLYNETAGLHEEIEDLREKVSDIEHWKDFYRTFYARTPDNTRPGGWT